MAGWSMYYRSAAGARPIPVCCGRARGREESSARRGKRLVHPTLQFSLVPNPILCRLHQIGAPRSICARSCAVFFCAFDVFGLFAFSLAKQAQREEARHDEGMDAAVSLHVIRTDMISASVADVCTWSVLSCPTCMSMMTMIL